MSKSLGNGIDPLEEIEKYGADALRLTLVTGNSPGNDMRYSSERVEASRNFANKLWNAARFVLMNLSDYEPAPHIPENLELEDKWILSKYNNLVSEVTNNLDKYELGLAIQKLYDFVWDVFCDWYIEIAKIRLYSEDESQAATARAVLVFVLDGILKLLHPFMPFITEEIWQSLPHKGESVMVADWPKFNGDLDFPVEEAEFERIMAAIRAIRNRRAEMNVPPSRKAKVYIASKYIDTFVKGTEIIKKLAYASAVEVDEEFEVPGSVTIVTDSSVISIPMAELVDVKAETERLQKELAAAQKDLEFVNNKLNNPNFVAKAPEAVVTAQRVQKEKLLAKIEMIKESLLSLMQ